MRMLSIGNCSRNSRGRFTSGRTPAARSLRCGGVGTNGERRLAALYANASYGLISGSGSMASPGRALISATCCCSCSMPLEHPLSDSTAKAATVNVDLVIGGAASELMSGAGPWARTRRTLLRLSRRLFVLVEVAIGLRRYVELQLVGVLGLLRDLDVVQRHDTRQRCDAADERSDRVEAAGEAHLDRQLGVKVLDVLCARLEQLLIEAGGGALLRDVGQQVRHFGLVRQLAQHRTERLFHLRELRLVGVEVRGLPGFRLELLQQLRLFAARGVQLRLLRLPRQEVREQHHCENEDEADRAEPERQRPAARIVRIEIANLVEYAHGRAPARFGAAATWSSGVAATCGFSCTAFNVKSEPPSPAPLVSRMSSEGSFSHSEASRLRM